MICRLAPGFSAWARDPLIHYIPHLKVPVSFILAENDFLRFDGLPELFEQGQMYPGSQLTVIPDTGHQITTDAPEFTCNHVIEFVFGSNYLQQYQNKLQHYFSIRDTQFEKM